MLRGPYWPFITMAVIGYYVVFMAGFALVCVAIMTPHALWAHDASNLPTAAICGALIGALAVTRQLTKK